MSTNQTTIPSNTRCSGNTGRPAVLILVVITVFLFTGCTSPADSETGYVKPSDNTTESTPNSPLTTTLPPPDQLDLDNLERSTFEESSPIPVAISYGDKEGNPRTYLTDNKDLHYHGEQIRADIERLKTGSLIIEDFNLIQSGMGQQLVEEIVGKPDSVAENGFVSVYVLDDGTAVELSYVTGEYRSYTLGTTIVTEIVSSAVHIDKNGVRNEIPLEQYEYPEKGR